MEEHVDVPEEDSNTCLEAATAPTPDPSAPVEVTSQLEMGAAWSTDVPPPARGDAVEVRAVKISSLFPAKLHHRGPRKTAKEEEKEEWYAGWILRVHHLVRRSGASEGSSSPVSVIDSVDVLHAEDGTVEESVELSRLRPGSGCGAAHLTSEKSAVEGSSGPPVIVT